MLYKYKVDYDSSVLRVLKKHTSVLPQLPLCFLFKKLQMSLQFPLPPLVGGVWEYTQNLLKKDEQGRERYLTARKREQLPNRPPCEEQGG